MLSSLFGDLRAIRAPRAPHPHGPHDPNDDGGFAATALMESIAHEVNDQGQIVDNHQKDMVVSGSPAQAIRDHFAATRADLETASRQITLVDPTGVWAGAVIKALSDATGRPVERLHLRQQGTLRTLATIERTTVARRNENALRIYHADVRAPGADNAAIPFALMEGSHLTAVIVGSMSPSEIDALLASVHTAVSRPEWRCPTLLFMLPPNAVWIANKVAAHEWPPAVRVQVLNEALTSASAVWNALLNLWNRVKTVPTLRPSTPPAEPDLADFPIKVADFARAPEAVALPVVGAAAPRRTPLAPDAADKALAAMLGIEGLLGCAVVDAATGFTLARQSRDDQHLHLELAAAGSAQVLRAHQQAAGTLGLPDPIDEIMTSAGGRHHVLRTVSHHPGLFLFALLDRQRTNLALARYKLMEAEQGLA